MSKTYNYLLTEFPNHKADAGRLSQEINENSSIYIALEYVTVESNSCDIVFKIDLSAPEKTVLDTVVSGHSGEPLPNVAPPTMPDGRPIVRADTRPLLTQTYFSMSGDTSSGIGDGKLLRWDFSNNDDPYDPSLTENGPIIPAGYKSKRVDLVFTDPTYLKDGTMYFFDASWGCYASMYITIPAGNYYPNPYGSIPAAALGLSGSGMYAYAAKDVFYAAYVVRHFMYTNCPMGDEMNAEGSQVDATPPGWYITALFFAPESDNVFKGYAEFELYRIRSIILPGELS
jgi:hypothetical protein